MKYKVKLTRLTLKQKQVLLFIQEFIEKEKYPPSIRDIAENFKISAKAAQDHTQAIVKKKYLQRKPYSSRSLVVIKKISKEYIPRKLKPNLKPSPEASLT